MKPFHHRLRGLALAAVLWAIPARAADAVRPLLVPRVEEASEAAAIQAPKWARSRPVAFDPAVLASLADRTSDRFRFETFDGESHVVRIAAVRDAGRLGTMLSGSVEDVPGSTAHVAVSRDAVSLGVNIPNRRPYAVRSAVRGLDRLCEVDLLRRKAGAAKVSAPMEPIPTGGSFVDRTSRRAAGPAGLPSGATAPTFLDLMVVYTPAAKSAAGGQSQIELEALKAVDVANLSHAQSNTGANLRLVYIGEFAFTETTDMSVDLDTLKDDSSLTALAGAHGADLVAVLMDSPDPDTTGIAKRPLNLASIPGTVCAMKWDHAYSGLTLAHETGHNLGCGHDAAHGDGIFDYSHGYVSGLFRTVMADDDLGGFIKRIPYYSNPNVEYVDAFGTHHTMGDASIADNARTIRETKAKAQAKRAPENAFYAAARCTDCTPGTAGAGNPGIGDATAFGPASRLAFLFDTTATSKDGLLTAIGLPAGTAANVYLDSSVRFPEKIRITRPCKLQRWSGHGTGNARISPN